MLVSALALLIYLYLLLFLHVRITNISISKISKDNKTIAVIYREFRLLPLLLVGEVISPDIDTPDGASADTARPTWSFE